MQVKNIFKLFAGAFVALAGITGAVLSAPTPENPTLGGGFRNIIVESGGTFTGGTVPDATTFESAVTLEAQVLMQGGLVLSGAGIAPSGSTSNGEISYNSVGTYHYQSLDDSASAFPNLVMAKESQLDSVGERNNVGNSLDSASHAVLYAVGPSTISGVTDEIISLGHNGTVAYIKAHDSQFALKDENGNNYFDTDSKGFYRSGSKGYSIGTPTTYTAGATAVPNTVPFAYMNRSSGAVTLAVPEIGVDVPLGYQLRIVGDDSGNAGTVTSAAGDNFQNPTLGFVGSFAIGKWGGAVITAVATGVWHVSFDY